MDCSICLDTVKIPTKLGCSHVFCLKCIISWLGVRLANLKCPLCRSFVDELGFVNRKFYDTDLFFLMQAFDHVRKNPNKTKQELYSLLQNELDQVDMFNENFDDIVIMYVCLQGFLAAEFEFLKSLM